MLDSKMRFVTESALVPLLPVLLLSSHLSLTSSPDLLAAELDSPPSMSVPVNAVSE